MSSPDKSEPDATVFICHSSIDKSVAEDLVEYLEATGIRCWIGPRDVAVGSDYATAIAGALKNAVAFVMIYSTSSAASIDCLAELEIAFRRRIPVLPYRIDDAPIVEEYEYRLARTQWTKGPTSDAARAIARAVLNPGHRQTRSSPSAGSIRISDLLDATLDYIESVDELDPSSAGPDPSPMGTGLPELDSLLGGGLHRGHLVTVAGEAAALLGLTIAKSTAVLQSQPTLLYVPHADPIEVIMRLLSSAARIATWRIAAGRMSEDDWNRLARTVAPVAGAPLHIATPAVATVADLENELASLPDLQCVVLPTKSVGISQSPDMPGLGGFTDSKKLHELAVEHDVAIVALSALLEPPGLDSDEQLQAQWVDGGAIVRLAHDIIVSVLPSDWPQSDDVVTLAVPRSMHGFSGNAKVRLQEHFSRFVPLRDEDLVEIGAQRSATPRMSAADREAWNAVTDELERMGELVSDDEDADPPDTPGPEADDDVEPLRPGQVIGMLEHLLGASPLDDESGPSGATALSADHDPPW